MDNWDKNYENNPPNFIMVSDGNGNQNAQEAQADQARTEQTQSEQGFYQGADTGNEKKKKEPKYITRKAFVITLICCMIATSGLTIAGYNLASQMGMGSTTKTVSATNYTLAKATGSEKSVEEIIAQNENAVVEIRTESVSSDSWMQNYVTEGAGSGVIIDTKGYILTCAHVVENSNKITVKLKDGTECEAEIVGMDSQNDIAVIQINAKNLTAATYGDSSELSVGDLVVAIGNPLGELGGSATTGIISALDREPTRL